MSQIQFLRTTDATKVPAGLAPGEVAFSLVNNWMFVGNGGDDILTPKTPVAAYGATATVLGVNNVVVPAKPTGKGYAIYQLEQAPPPAAKVLSITDDLVNGAAGTGVTAKTVAALTTASRIAGQADLRPGDLVIITAGVGSPFAGAPIGSFVWDGTSLIATGGGSLPDATDRTASGTAGSKGVVYLARDTDVAETGAAAATTPDPLAVATGAQVKALADRVGSLATGHALLGTYDGTTSQVATVNTSAAAGGRTGLTVGAKLSAAAALKAGDYFVVSKAGTIAGDASTINQAVTAGDQLLWDGSEWRVVPMGSAGGALLHGLADVSDSAVAVVAAADVKGLLVRDNPVSDGLPGAYKIVSVLDLGVF